MGTNKAIIYGIASILGLIFIWKNLFFLMFCGAIVGGLYYFLEVRGSDDDDDEPVEELEDDF
jgi:predicted MFS family arabinose efflux permease